LNPKQGVRGALRSEDVEVATEVAGNKAQMDAVPGDHAQRMGIGHVVGLGSQRETLAPFQKECAPRCFASSVPQTVHKEHRPIAVIGVRLRLLEHLEDIRLATAAAASKEGHGVGLWPDVEPRDERSVLGSGLRQQSIAEQRKESRAAEPGISCGQRTARVGEDVSAPIAGQPTYGPPAAARFSPNEAKRLWS